MIVALQGAEVLLYPIACFQYRELPEGCAALGRCGLRRALHTFEKETFKPSHPPAGARLAHASYTYLHNKYSRDCEQPRGLSYRETRLRAPSFACIIYSDWKRKQKGRTLCTVQKLKRSHNTHSQNEFSYFPIKRLE